MASSSKSLLWQRCWESTEQREETAPAVSRLLLLPTTGWLQPQARGSQHILGRSQRQRKSGEAEGPSPAVSHGLGGGSSSERHQPLSSSFSLIRILAP